GLVRFDGVHFLDYSTRNIAEFRQNSVQALAEGNDGSLWIGTADGLLRKRGETFVAYRVADGLPDGSVQALLAGPDGGLWIGTERGGLALWSHEHFLPARTRAQGLPDDNIRTLARTRDGALWVGTGEGLARLAEGDIRSLTR